MKLLGQIFTGCVSLIGIITHFLSKFTDVIDSSISIVAGLIGIFAGVIYALFLYSKLKNERLEKEIKELEIKKLNQQLDNLSETEI